MDFPIRDIYERRPDVIFFSCYIWNIEYVRNIAREVKKVIPDIRVWFGGPEVSYDGVEILEKNPYLDGVMIGEGEQVFKHLMEYYCDGTIGLTDIPGIMYRTENGPILKNPNLSRWQNKPLLILQIRTAQKKAIQFPNK